MARTDNEVRITPSVLDRLMDYEPEITHEPLASRAKSLRQMKQSVRRDLEWLLNTRQLVESVPSDLKEVSNSVAAYGLPDFSNATVSSLKDQDQMRLAIEFAINTFEPRLQDVTVTLEPGRGSERLLRFRIDAHLKIEPAPEPVTFDTELQLHSGEYKVQGD
jgi:type VI secretion system protein ImpF